VLPIYFEATRFTILKFFAALLFAQGPLDMVFRSFATIAMTNTAITNLQNLEDELDQHLKNIPLHIIPQEDMKEIKLKSVQFNYTDHSQRTTEPVAIIGMGCRFPRGSCLTKKQ